VARNEKKSRGYAIGEDEDGNDNRGSGEEDSTDHDWDNEQAKTLCYGDVHVVLRSRTFFLIPRFESIPLIKPARNCKTEMRR
jgi:hypothetical protein